MTEFRQFTLLGSGRLARHLSFYLESLNLPFVTWSRASDPLRRELLVAAENSSHILLAVSDSAVEEVAAPLRGSGRVLVHFSGAMSVPEVFSAHPLMTFGSELRSLDWYRKIPFVVEPKVEFSSLLPGLPNPSFSLSRENKALYHALCALAGNSVHLLWQKISVEFARIGLDPAILRPYLHEVVENFSREENFTGPVARGDWTVVREHLRALACRDDLLKSYRGFLHLARNAGVALPKDLQ